jgi:cobalt-zinc-cadmium efflux system membrane fusion protein
VLLLCQRMAGVRPIVESFDSVTVEAWKRASDQRELGMNRSVLRVSGLVFSMVCLKMLAGCGGGGVSKTTAKVAPAEVRAVPDEANLADVVLTQPAFDRLGITTARAELRSAVQIRQLGAEVVLPPGDLAVVVTPVAGTVQARSAGSVLQPGAQVRAGEEIFLLQPLLSPERFTPTPAERAQIAGAQASLVSLQITAAGDVRQLREQVAAAKIALDRAKQLRQDRVGSETAVDDAIGRMKIAEAGLSAAEDRKAELDRLSANLEGALPEPISFAAPMDGILRNVLAAPGQQVGAGGALFEIVGTGELWVRVPVYVGLLDRIRSDAAVQVRSAVGQQRSVLAEPVQAPPQADPASFTADVFYRLDNSGGGLRPGQRVFVAVPLTGEEERLAVPANSVLYDIYGGTWVYRQVSALTFRRSRVVVGSTEAGFAMLSAGLETGAEVVVDGAAEVFGTEFGTGK